PDTAYCCVVDRDGNAFSATPSDSALSSPLVPGLGFALSSRGSQSWLDPAHTSRVEGGKRPRLTPNPALALRDGELFMPCGCPGHRHAHRRRRTAAGQLRARVVGASAQGAGADVARFAPAAITRAHGVTVAPPGRDPVA